MALGSVKSERVWEPISELARKVNARELSAEELVQKALQLIDEFDDEYKVVISKTVERAMQRAKQIDDTIKTGKSAGRLAGVKRGRVRRPAPWRADFPPDRRTSVGRKPAKVLPAPVGAAITLGQPVAITCALSRRCQA